MSEEHSAQLSVWDGRLGAYEYRERSRSLGRTRRDVPGARFQILPGFFGKSDSQLMPGVGEVVVHFRGQLENSSAFCVLLSGAPVLGNLK